MTTLQTAREIRAERSNLVATGLENYTGENALFDAGADKGIWDLKPQLRPITNEDGYTHLEYKLTRSGETALDEFGKPIVANSLNEITIVNPHSGERQAIPFRSAGKVMNLWDHNRLVPVAKNWIGEGAKLRMLHVSDNFAVVTVILELPDLFKKFSGMNTLLGCLILQNSIDGTKRFGARFGAEKYACLNMSWFTDENSFSTKHTKRISIRVDQQISLQHEKIRETAQVMETQFEQLANVTMDNSQTVEFLQTFLVQENKHVSNKTVYTDLVGAAKTKIDNRIETIVGLSNGVGDQGNTVGEIGGSAYGVYQAILEETDWYRDGAKRDRDGEINPNFQSRQNARTLQAMGVDTSTVQFKQNALTAISNYATERELVVA